MLLGILDIRLNSEIQTCVFVYGLDITYASREIIQAINISIRALPHCLKMSYKKKKKTSKDICEAKNGKFVSHCSELTNKRCPMADTGCDQLLPKNYLPPHISIMCARWSHDQMLHSEIEKNISQICFSING